MGWGAIGGALVGGLISDRNNKRSQERAQSYENPKKIRKRYEKAGFNPLLAFGGNGAGTIAPAMGQSTAWGELLSSGMAGIQQTKIAQARLEQENERLKLMAQEIALKDRPRSYPSKTSPNKVGDQVKKDVDLANIRPQARPTAQTQERSPVFLPDGQQAMVPKTWSDRMGIGAWGQLGSGDYAEAVGEIRGEAESTLLVDKIGQTFGVPLFGGPGSWKPTPPTPRASPFEQRQPGFFMQ